MRLLTLSIALVLALLWVTPAAAQYTNTPIVETNAGHYIDFLFSGPGLNDKIQRFPVPTDLTPAQALTQLREWIGTQVVLLNKYNSAANVAALQKGQTITGLPAPAPVVAPGPTAAQAWAGRYRLLNFLRAGGTLTGALATDITTLATEVSTTYNNASAALKLEMFAAAAAY